MPAFEPPSPYLPWGPDAGFITVGGYESFRFSTAFINSAEGPAWGGDVGFDATTGHQIFPRPRTRQSFAAAVGFQGFPIREPG